MRVLVDGQLFLATRPVLEGLTNDQLNEAITLLKAEAIRRAIRDHEGNGGSYGALVDSLTVDQWLWLHRWRIPAMFEVAENLMTAWTERCEAARAVMKDQRTLPIRDPSEKAKGHQLPNDP